jgi:hypothetical protein
MFCLGRKPAKFDPKVPKIMELNLRSDVLPSISDEWKNVQYWPLLKNDVIGDCTIAGVGHVIEYWNYVGKLSLPTMTDLEAEVQYQILGQYVPGDANTDNGCVELDVLNYFKTHGIMAGSQIVHLNRFLSVPHNDLQQIKSAIHHLGNCYFGYELPSNAASQTNLWDIDLSAQIEGGHAINAIGYDDNQQLLYVVSWGEVVPVTYDFHQKYCEESWSLYSDARVNR